MIATNEAARKLARNIYWQYLERVATERGYKLTPGEKERCLHGRLDRRHGVQIAIAAIEKTTELAAKAADKERDFREAAEIKARQEKRRAEARDFDSMRIECVHIAHALRAYAHLKGSTDE